MDAPALKRGVIQAFDPANWTPTVQVLPSQGDYLSGVQVAKHLLAAEIVPGDQCAVLFFDELNPADAIIFAVYSVPPAGPVPPVTSLAGGAGGAALTGDVQLVPGPSGNVSISESGQQILIDASGSAGVTRLFQEDTTSHSFPATSANNLLETVNFTSPAGGKITVSWVFLVKAGSTSQGFHPIVNLDGVQVAATLSATKTAGNTSEPMLHSETFMLNVSAGAHTLTLSISTAFTTVAYTVNYSQLAVAL